MNADQYDVICVHLWFFHKPFLTFASSLHDDWYPLVQGFNTLFTLAVTSWSED